MQVVIDFINRNVEFGMVGRSIYLQHEDILVRIANHLPQVANIEAYNEDATKVILVFFESDLNTPGCYGKILTEYKIQDFIESEMRNFEVEYVIISEENKLDDYSEMLINNF